MARTPYQVIAFTPEEFANLKPVSGALSDLHQHMHNIRNASIHLESSMYNFMHALCEKFGLDKTETRKVFRELKETIDMKDMKERIMDIAGESQSICNTLYAALENKASIYDSDPNPVG